MKKKNKKIKNLNKKEDPVKTIRKSLFNNEDMGEENENDKEFEITKEAMQRISMIPLMEWLKGKRLRFWGWGILYTILLAILSTQVKLLQLNSESIQYKYCVQLNNIEPEKGELCVFDYRKYTFVKYLAGVEGDRVKRVEENVYINDELVCKIPSNNNLTPIDDMVIPKGYVFVKGTHADSLDSRYKEFGLVKISSLKGKAVGWMER